MTVTSITKNTTKHKFFNIRQATALKAAAVIVASPRYMGAFGAAVGADIHAIMPGLITAEIWSGLAMALLEGAAVGYVFGQWRKMEKGSLDWWILTGLLSALLALLPMIAAPYLMAMQFSTAVADIVSLPFLWVWSVLVAGLPVVLIAAVGYADIEVQAQPAIIVMSTPQARSKRKPAKAQAAILPAQSSDKPEEVQLQAVQPAPHPEILQGLQGLNKAQAVPIIAQLEKHGREFNNIELADAIGNHPSTIGRWRPAIDNAKLNGGHNGNH